MNLKGSVQFKGFNQNGEVAILHISYQIIETLYDNHPKQLLYLKNELKHAIQAILEDRGFDFDDISTALARLGNSYTAQRVVKMIVLYEKFTVENGLDDESLKLLING